MEMLVVSAFLGFFIVTMTAAGLTAIVLEGTRRTALLDVPNSRSLHTTATPRGGGLVIAGITLLAATAWLLAAPPEAAGRLTVLVWIAGGSAIAAISFADDIRSRSATLRLAVHVLAAGALVGSAPDWSELILPGLPVLTWGALGNAFLFLWITWLINCYNFMDGIDGIAGLQAVVASAGWTLLGLTLGDPLLIWVGVSICGSATAFLFFNWPPARIFMGDVGSTFLGFTFAALPLLATARDLNRDPTLLVVCSVLFVWPFVFDAAWTILRRWRSRENLLSAHRSHLYQRLVISGLSPATVSRHYALLALVGVVLSFSWIRGASYALGLTVTVLAAFAWLLVRWTRVREERPPTVG